MRKIKIPSIIFSCLTILLTANICNAQNLIAVQNGNNRFFFRTLDSAITQAQNGDTIYIPGGGYPLTVAINKPIHIFGVGHNPDSTLATNKTIIASDIYVFSNASYGSITGIYCTGTLRFGNSLANQNVNHFTIKRCNIEQGTFIGFADTSGATNNSFIENIFHKVFLLYAQNNSFYNNLIMDYVKDIGVNNNFRNNNFNNSGATNYQDGYFWYGIQANIVNSRGSQFDNNIFRGRLISAGGYNLNFSNNTFYNNLFADGAQIGSPLCSGCTDFYSLFNQPDSSILVNFPNSQNFSYVFNSHLKPTSPGINAGNDGTNLGIYGGLYPWKEGSIPSNPHIQYKNLSNATDPNGNLLINIKVAAQNH